MTYQLSCIRWCEAIALSEDHKPNTESERTRIENDGGVVIWAGTWRVGGVLAVSRAFGDRPLKKYVISTPDVHEESMTGDDEVLILASDGLWDVVSNKVRADLLFCMDKVSEPRAGVSYFSEILLLLLS